MGFYGARMGHRRVVSSLDNALRLGESLLHIPVLKLDAVAQVAAPLRLPIQLVGGGVLMHQRRVRRQRLLRVKHRRQSLPLHLHQGGRLPRQIRRLRRHRGDGVAPKSRLVQSEHPLVLKFVAEITHFQVAASDHRLDPGQA